MIVITGGAGFIGSCIVSRLNQAGRDDLVIVDHLDEGSVKSKNIEGKKYQQYLDKGEFLEKILGDGLDFEVEALIHMGACSSTVLQDKEYFQKNNFEYTVHCARWALQRHVRFIYASSAATYGSGSSGYSDDDDITRQLQPLNLYGESKHKFDMWVLDNQVQEKVAGLKFFNVFGPNEYHKGEMKSVVAKAFDRAVKEGKIFLFKSYKADIADGEQKRDFIYIKDAVDIVMFFFEHPDINGIFNVGTGQAHSWNDLANALFAAVGRDPDIEYIDMPENIKPRYQYFTQAQMQKIRDAGYRKPFMPLIDSVKHYSTFLRDKTYM